VPPTATLYGVEAKALGAEPVWLGNALSQPAAPLSPEARKRRRPQLPPVIGGIIGALADAPFTVSHSP